MPHLPQPLPEKGPLRALYSWLNDLRDYVRTTKPLQSYNCLTTHTSGGVVRTPIGGRSETVESAEAEWV